jgi:hypothetical protein
MPDSKHKDHHVTETPDVSYIKNVDVTHEKSDVNIGGISKFILALSVMTIAVSLLMWGMFRVFRTQTEEAPPSAMSLTEKERIPPEPRLQGAPGFAEELQGKTKPAKVEEPGIAARSQDPKDALWEIKVLREHWNDVLEHGPVDQNGMRYGMPIEKAKEEILKQGLPARESRKQ